jgi:acyl-[acyl-carrier-protein]-phospholipid O-acyltransferase/long-chain-fatty-acid--[acyl-carrier-protein] ligase
MNSTQKRSFWALMATQFSGAFNDNILKILVSLQIIALVANTKSRDQLVDFSGEVFVAPFILFSMISGRICDRVAKSKVAVATKFWELLVIAAAAVSLHLQSITGMMISLFLISMQATFFSPAKYGLLPELSGEKDLSVANGWLNMATFLAILMGTLVGSFLGNRVYAACAVMAIASLVGLITSFSIKGLPAARPNTPLKWNPFSDLLENWQLIRQDRSLMLGMIAVNYFWFLAAVVQLTLFLYVKDMMVSPQWIETLAAQLGSPTNQIESGVLIVALAIGIGFGSWLAGRFSEGRVEVGLVPIGSFGMGVFSTIIGFSYSSLTLTLVAFVLLGVNAGLYEIPLMSLIQWRSPATDRGRVLATANFLSFIAIALGSAALFLLHTFTRCNPAQIFLVLGFISFIGTGLVCRFVPDASLRVLLYIVTRTFYRMRVVGGENVPLRGPALLVSNHLSLADGFIVGSAVPRLVRFLLWRPYYEAKAWHWMMRTMKAIPISEKDSPRAILSSLLAARKAIQDGDIVCLFAEGQISRTGNLLEFKRGFEIIVKDLDVPVIPVHLDRIWGSIFSFEHGKVIFKWPRRIPYPVTVTFGKPVGLPVSPERVRQAVLDLGADAFNFRLEKSRPLVIEFLKRAKQQPLSLAMADSMGKELSFNRLAAASAGLADVLEELLSDGETSASPIGLLLPSSVGGALANLAVSLLGRVPINLNYTAGAGAIEHAVKKAGIRHILTSRKLLQKANLPERPEMLFLEDIAPRVSKINVLLNQALFIALPTGLAVRRLAKRVLHVPLSDTATVVFSSGSTGVPKGVVLTHANILSNILGISQVFDLGRNDRMLGVLPFFHSFGFTVTLWFPLIKGFSAIYHTNPLEAKIIGELAEKYKATVMLSTPTFLGAYTRKCTPEQFKHLRYVITGAERMRESIAKAFQEKFGVPALEGYGTTELSPVATVNIPNVSMGEINQVGNKAGKIGHPIPGVSVKIVDPETFADRPQGESGMLLVKGPNVMKEYLGEPEKTAQAMHDGWYITCDIAQIDHDGFVQIVDRLSRFSKIGGEMVPHMMLEDKLHQLAQSAESMFAVTAVPEEKKGEELVVLYTPCAMDEIYKKLQDSDLPKLWIPGRDRFFEVPALPVLGTGKLDLQLLKQIAKEKTSSL